VYHQSNSSDIPLEKKEILAKLRKITVIGVPSITTTLSLESFQEKTPEYVAFEEANDKITVFVSNALGPGKSIHPSICTSLGRMLGVEMMTLFTCITQPVDTVNYLFEFNGIEKLPDDHDRSWLQTITQPNVPVVPEPVVAEKSPSPAPPSTPPPRPSTALSVNDEGDFPRLRKEAPKTLRHTPSLSSTSTFQQSQSPSKGRQRQQSWAHSSVGVSEHSQFLPPSRSPFSPGNLQPLPPINNARDTNRLTGTALMEPSANEQQVVPSTLGVPVWPPFGNFNAPMATDETDMVGIMGEYFVRSFFYKYIHVTEKNKNGYFTLLKKKGIQTTSSYAGRLWTCQLDERAT
jgi:hypothetical protein